MGWVLAVVGTALLRCLRCGRCRRRRQVPSRKHGSNAVPTTATLEATPLLTYPSHPHRTTTHPLFPPTPPQPPLLTHPHSPTPPYSPPLPSPQAPFEILVRASIRKLLPPALQCSHLVHQELLRVAAACQSDALERFPLLQKELDAAVADLVSQGTGPCEKMIRDLVDCELALINTAHPAFIGGARAVTAVVDRRRGGGGVTAHRVSASGGVLTRASVMAGVAAAHAAAHAGRRADDLTNPANPTTSASSSPRVVLHTPGSNRAHASPRTSDATPIDAATPAQPRVGFASVLDPPPTPGSLLRPPPPVLVVDDGPSEQDGIEVEVTRMLVDSYFRIVRSTLQDMVPKVVMQFLVGNITRELHQHLVQTLYR